MGFGRKRLWPNRGTNPAFALRNLGKPRKPSVRTESIPTEQLPYTILMRYRYINPLGTLSETNLCLSLSSLLLATDIWSSNNCTSTSTTHIIPNALRYSTKLSLWLSPSVFYETIPNHTDFQNVFHL
jgi:hypothetical protein